MVHVNLVPAAIELIYNVIAGRFLTTVIRSNTTLFRSGIRIALLHLLLDFVSGITAGGSARKAGDDACVPTADSTTKQSSNNGAHTGTD